MSSRGRGVKQSFLLSQWRVLNRQTAVQWQQHYRIHFSCFLCQKNSERNWKNRKMSSLSGLTDLQIAPRKGLLEIIQSTIYCSCICCHCHMQAISKFKIKANGNHFNKSTAAGVLFGRAGASAKISMKILVDGPFFLVHAQDRAPAFSKCTKIITLADCAPK